MSILKGAGTRSYELYPALSALLQGG